MAYEQHSETFQSFIISATHNCSCGLHKGIKTVNFLWEYLLLSFWERPTICQKSFKLVDVGNDDILYSNISKIYQKLKAGVSTSEQMNGLWSKYTL